MYMKINVFFYWNGLRLLALARHHQREKEMMSMTRKTYIVSATAGALAAILIASPTLAQDKFGTTTNGGGAAASQGAGGAQGNFGTDRGTRNQAGGMSESNREARGGNADSDRNMRRSADDGDDTDRRRERSAETRGGDRDGDK